MPDFDVKEKRFEQDIETFLCTDGGYVKVILVSLTANWRWTRKH